MDGSEGLAMTQVVAALIVQGDRFLICQRPAGKAQGLLWEFAGGKVEPGELPEQALVRECREELGVTVRVGAPFAELTHAYPERTIHLTLFYATIVSGVLQNLEHPQLRWITAEQIPQFSFCPADAQILHRLQSIF